MDAGYVKLDNDTAIAHLVPHADPALACWAALVQVWDGIEGTLEDTDPPGGAGNATPIMLVRPFG
ncbi:hypothetical protein [Pseudoduganella umbonata]|uniref:Uncharacterized protein n=1 Tax=Pseudoduganella umbonata TaxID=864828 RepID=A0A4P8HNV7_9BURK|nr:hypothetical protein [Pseudoduganella umbonata]MBB3222740.1 hypothetical protein [Pseudoduganella umbonata]QCP10766.1 hypothetical protein FCL38_10235 [Pseudoduganella umbonata]